jgi:gamma-glutamylcyclotransferase (GGCT)/AIG2-like uncharacterized protein YtfP
VSERVFFYGTLMTGFDRPGRRRLDAHLTFAGRGSIAGALYDLGIYPAAIPAQDGRVWGEIYTMADPQAVLPALDEIEGFRASEPERSLYTRVMTTVTLEDGSAVDAWTYFYNAPLGRAPRIDSGDYRLYLKS